MKKEYDFSKGVRGKFYHGSARLNLPVYLDTDVLQFVQKIAQIKRTDVSSVVNRLLKSDMHLVKATK